MALGLSYSDKAGVNLMKAMHMKRNLHGTQTKSLETDSGPRRRLWLTSRNKAKSCEAWSSGESVDDSNMLRA